MTIPNRLLAVAVLVGPIAAGCGGKQEPPAPPPPMAQAASPAAAVTGSPTPETAMASPAPSAQAAPAPVSNAKPAAPVATLPTTTLAPTRPTPTPATVATPPPAVSSPSPRPAETAPAPPAAKLPTRPQPQGKVTLPAKLGAVTFDHQKHAKAMAIACTECHHPSRPEKPLAAQQQSCRECHTSPATPPVKTSLQAAFHDPKATTGTCLECHREAVAKGKKPPVGCLQCHKKK